MKKHILILLIILLLLSVTTLVHGEDESISISIDNEYIRVGDNVKVNVNLKDKDEVKGIELYLKYDQNYLDPLDTAFTKGSLIEEEYFYTAINEINEEESSVRFMGTSLRGGLPIMGGGELFSFDFKALRAGSTSVYLNKIKLINGEMEALEIGDKTMDITINSSRDEDETSEETNNTNDVNNTSTTEDEKDINIKGDNVDNITITIGVIPINLNDDIILVSEIYDIQSNLHNGEGTYKLDPPLELSIKYNYTEDLDEDKLGIYYFNENKNEWIYIGGDVDKNNKVVNVTINHLTKFAVFKNPNIKELRDIKGHWSNPYVKRLLGMNVITGYEDGNFKPEKEVTREEFSKLIVLALYLEESKENIEFNDSDLIQAWAKESVNTAYNNKILSGYEDGCFRPKQAMTRAEMTTALGNLLNTRSKNTYSKNLDAYKDFQEVPSWAVENMNICLDLGIINGFEDNTLRPNKNLTRAQAATMIYMTLWELGM